MFRNLIAFICIPVFAQQASIVRVTSETAPPGGMAQVKVLLYSPQPISSGGMDLSLSDYSFDSVDGVALFSGTGDVSGTALVDSGRIYVQFTSPKATFGTAGNYPLMAVTLGVSKDAQVGKIYPVSLSASSSTWRNLLGSPIPVILEPGSITVGGSLNITNVIPGGGKLSAGSIVRIIGSGFSDKTRVQLTGLGGSIARYVSPTEIQVKLSQAGTLDGTMIQLVNPDNFSDTYYSYLRGIPLGQSTRPLLTQTVPVFSINTAVDATLPPLISSLVNKDYFTGIALQNPNPGSANVTIESRDVSGMPTGSTLVTLPPYARFTREVSELFGAALSTGSYLHVVSTLPVQMLGLLGNDRTRTVLPITLVVSGSGATDPPEPVDSEPGL